MEQKSEQKSEPNSGELPNLIKPPPKLFTNTEKPEPGDKAQLLNAFYKKANLFLHHLNNRASTNEIITGQYHQVEESLLALIERASKTKAWLNFYGYSIKSRFQIYDYIEYVKNQINTALTSRISTKGFTQLNLNSKTIFNIEEYNKYITAMKELIEKNNQLYIDSKQNPIKSGGTHHPYKKSYHRPAKHRKRTLRHKTRRSSKRRIIK